MSDFKELDAWRHARRLIGKVYVKTRAFPRSEIFGLTSQLRRSATSVAANIAESCGRAGDRDQSRFLRIAMGSARELESHLLIATDLEFLASEDHDDLAKDVTRLQQLLSGMLRHRAKHNFPRRMP